MRGAGGWKNPGLSTERGSPNYPLAFAWTCGRGPRKKGEEGPILGRPGQWPFCPWVSDGMSVGVGRDSVF
jgi:hypothetical protein